MCLKPLTIGSLVFASAIAQLVSFPAVCYSQTPEDRGPLIRGFVVAPVHLKRQRRELAQRDVVYLPNVRVVLRDVGTNDESQPVTTDLSGRFTARVKRPGRYRVCWKSRGFEAGCTEEIFSVSDSYHYIGTIEIPLPTVEGSVSLYGRVTLADGSSARTLEASANINAFARLSLTDSAGNVLFTVPVNNQDQYLFPSVPLGDVFHLRTKVEKYDHRQLLQLGNSDFPVQSIDFTIMNSPPRIEPLVALDGNDVRVSNATPGQSVRLHARVSDADKDNVRFLWRVSSGNLSSTNEREPKWTLPAIAGNHAATLIVYDGKGGYARSSLNLTIDRGGLVFSGAVSGTDASVLPGAEVNVNGRTAVTDSSGFFRLRVPDKKRFVMTIRKRGYAFASNIYYDRVVGGRWQLTRATLIQIDPNIKNDVQSERSPQECSGPPSARLNWEGNPTLAIPQYQDGHGNVVVAPKQVRELPGLPIRDQPRHGNVNRDCGPGFRVVIPARSLVDSRGVAPTGMVDLQISTIDLRTPNQMPGNYTVARPDGRTGVMQSYGAGTIEVFSGATKYNLAPNARAKIFLPVDEAQLQSGGALPETIPLLTYQEARGVWTEDGEAVLQDVGGRPTYVAEVTHFTAYNTDLIKNDQACLAVQNDGMPPSYNLEVTIPQLGGLAPVTRFLPGVEGGNTEIAILNLPKETNIVLTPIRTDDPDPDKNNLPMGVFVVNTGAPQNPTWPTVPGGFANEPVGPPYYQETAGVSDGACSTKIVLRDLGLQFYPETPPTGAFLHGLTFAAVNLSETDPAFPGDANGPLREAVEEASQDYNDQIDPQQLRATLSCFKAVNRMPLKPGETCPEHAAAGFTPQPELSETSAVFANSADLGFGREMHCVQDGGNVACYVSNYDSLVYTGPGQGTDVSKAQTAVDGFTGTGAPDATVAMEYSAIEGDTPPQPVVKFYVFNQAGNPVNKANLDGLGDRPVPQLCMVCHGGAIPNAVGLTTVLGVGTPVFGNATDVKLNAKFLPFDLRSFSFAAPDTDTSNLFNKLNQQDEFQELNRMVKVAPPPDSTDSTSDVIVDLYDTWYPADALPQIEDQAVPKWNTDALHADAYVQVVGRSCRTCHVANAFPGLRFDQPGASPGLGFDGNLGAVQLKVCKEHVMPHARRTHDLFWTSVSPNQGANLQAFGDTVNAFGWQRVGGSGVDPSLICGQEFTQGGGPPVPFSAFTAVQEVFTANCTGCHYAARAALSPTDPGTVAGLNLEGSEAYGRIVDVDANELTSMKRVAFGASSENTSYLWRKISDTHEGLGTYSTPGPGVAMPQFTSGLETIDPAAAIIIRDWIRAGAQP